MLKRLKKGTTVRSSKLQLGWSYAPITNQDGQPTGLARISYRIRIFPFAVVQVDVSEHIAEVLCQELNSKT